MINLLTESGIFAGCTGRELTEIANVALKIGVTAGESIFTAGSPADHLFIVLDGSVALRFQVSYLEEKRNITLDRKSAGEAFGWSVFVEPSLYTLSAVAVEQSELMKIRKQDLDCLCAGNHHLGYVIMKNISEIIAERFAMVQNRLVNAIQLDLRDREV